MLRCKAVVFYRSINRLYGGRGALINNELRSISDDTAAEPALPRTGIIRYRRDGRATPASYLCCG